MPPLPSPIQHGAQGTEQGFSLLSYKNIASEFYTISK